MRCADCRFVTGSDDGTNVDKSEEGDDGEVGGEAVRRLLWRSSDSAKEIAVRSDGDG